MSGIVLIRENERAVVTRFGRAEADLSPGLYWRYPAPFERVFREPVGRLRTVQIGFRAAETSAVRRSRTSCSAGRMDERAQRNRLRDASRGIARFDGGRGPRRNDGRSAVADRRICGSTCSTRPRPVDTLRTLAESVVRETAAREPLDGILTDRRHTIEEECLATLRARLKQQPLGIEVVDLTLLDVHPPREVVASYRDVADALEEREQRVNEAEAYYAGKLLAAAGERAVRTLNAAAPDARRRPPESTAGGVSNWALTDSLWAELSQESPESPMALSGEAAGLLLSARQAATNATQSARGQAARFNELLSAYQSQSRLTGFELYWQTIVESLSNRTDDGTRSQGQRTQATLPGRPGRTSHRDLYCANRNRMRPRPTAERRARAIGAGSVAGRPGHARARRRARTATMK